MPDEAEQVRAAVVNRYGRLAEVREEIRDAVFDRVLIYRSRVLHSGQIDPTVGLSADPARGRLTANIFLNYAAVSKPTD